MMSLRQGQHQKTESLIDDQDVRFACLQFLRMDLQEELSLESPVEVHSNTA
jgi:hypothetical protein